MRIRFGLLHFKNFVRKRDFQYMFGEHQSTTQFEFREAASCEANIIRNWRRQKHGFIC